ncbi:MAG: Flp pilus assembly complex ATPase component [PVC group bacterium]|nr:Flp pilus assembly complex ATPase component [PVC group bacterium]
MTVNSRVQFIGNLLVEKGFLTKAAGEKISQKITPKDIPQSQEELEALFLEPGIVSEEDLLTAYSQHLNIPYLDLSTQKIDSKTVAFIPAKFANKNKVIVIKKEDDKLFVAMRNPFAIDVLDELKILTKLYIQPVLSRSEDILNAIGIYYGVGAETVETLVQDKKTESSQELGGGIQEAEDEDKGTNDASIIQYVNQILLEAYRKRATDIHIEPFEQTLRIRYRIDGILSEAKTPTELKRLHVSIISRLKIMANLNIAEKRRPQDGRCKMKLQSEEIDLRLSTFPTLYGEGVSIRLLTKSMILLGVDQLGLSKDMVDQLKGILQKTNGMVLVTGPTGCGKTTTLYSCLNYLNTSQVNIITLEDPVEYQLEGVNQIQINPQADLVFSSGLRSILRQDPDIIMVGEVRDLETAQIAVRAALTGHLLFSTLHTNNALATITRLLDLGIEPFLVSGTVRGVIAQRLVRKICESCKKKYKPDRKLLKMVGMEKQKINFVRGKGCEKCNNTGYKGRIGIYELLLIDEHLGALISSGASVIELKKQAQKNGMKSLKEDGFDKVRQGQTTIEEVIRVTEQE